MQREAPQVAHRFKFLEVSDYTESDLSEIIDEMGAVPPYKGRSGFIAVWRDGGARLYEGQPQSMYLANWLLTLETSALFKSIQTKSARKAFQHQDNVRVLGYFKHLDAAADPQFATFLEVAKRFHLDIEFAAVSDMPTAKFFKLKNPGDVAIMKPSEPALVWSQSAELSLGEDASGTSQSRLEVATHHISESSTSTEAVTTAQTAEEEDEDAVKMWNYDTLNKWIQRNKKALWTEIKVPSMFSHWFSTLPKVLLVVPNRGSLSRSEFVSHAFSNFKTLSKQYARNLGLEFLLLDASIFTQVPQALEISQEELPAFVPFRDSKSISNHVLKIDPNDSAKESYTRMKSFLDDYLRSQSIGSTVTKPS